LPQRTARDAVERVRSRGIDGTTRVEEIVKAALQAPTRSGT
jgi:hypothetical protein